MIRMEQISTGLFASQSFTKFDTKFHEVI